MPGKGPLAVPRDVVYLYDGSLAGFYCCVHESVYGREIPQLIAPIDESTPTLLKEKLIETCPDKAAKVRAAIPKKISQRALTLVENTFCTCLPAKELRALRFLLFAFRAGRNAADNLSHPDVSPLVKAEHHLLHEQQLLSGFIRFSDYDGALAAVITPKNFVLPYLAGHFIARFSQEDFLIFDSTHGAALVYQNRNADIIPIENIEFPEAGEEELKYRAMWKNFYNTVSIKERENPVCRRTHMPKRYWANMLEVAELL